MVEYKPARAMCQCYNDQMNTPQNTPDNNLLSAEDINGSLAIVQEVFKSFRPKLLELAGNIAHTDKKDGSPVTEMDVEVEEKLQAVLAQHYPGVPVYGEEGGYEDHMSGAFWLVDPIDGTKAFVEGVPTFTSMAVLIQEDEAVAVVIYNPSADVTYTAQKGKGAYKDNTRLNMNDKPMSAIAYCKEELIETLNSFMQPVGVTCQDAPTGGGYGFTMVAEGTAAARFNLHSRGHTHDYAPGGLLVVEAGGVLIPVKEDTYNYETRSFVACHPQLAPTIRENLATIRSVEK